VAKVLISDQISDEGIRILEREGSIEVEVKTGLSPKELIACIGGYDGLIVRSATKVTSEVISAADKLRVIGRAGVGYDNIDLEAASERGIVVMNSPEGNTNTAAEHAIALLMSLARNIPLANQSVKSGKWERSRFMGVEVMGKTLGVIGLGRIGSIVAKRAMGLAMKILAYDPYISEEAASRLGLELVSLEELLRRSDYITLHTPRTPETRNLIGPREFALMKEGVRLINCARGQIVDEQALYDALVSGKVAGAGLDVFAQEPPGDSPLLKLDQVICTPHLGASTTEAQVRVATAIAEQVVDFFSTGQIRNAVNAPSVHPENLPKIRPYTDLAERLGSFAAQLMEGGVRQVRVEYAGELVQRESKVLTLSVLAGFLCQFLHADVNIVNAPLIAESRGIRILETHTSPAEMYPNLITVAVVTDRGELTVGGSRIHERDSRIVRVDQFRLEAIPEGHILVWSNQDMPGIMGKIATILGENDINIGAMHLARTKPRGTALCMVNVDSDIPEDAVRRIAALPYIIYAKMVHL